MVWCLRSSSLQQWESCPTNPWIMFNAPHLGRQKSPTSAHVSRAAAQLQLTPLEMRRRSPRTLRLEAACRTQSSFQQVSIPQGRGGPTTTTTPCPSCMYVCLYVRKHFIPKPETSLYTQKYQWATPPPPQPTTKALCQPPPPQEIGTLLGNPAASQMSNLIDVICTFL